METPIISVTPFDTSPMADWPGTPPRHLLQRIHKAVEEETDQPADPAIREALGHLVTAYLAAAADELMGGGLDRIAAEIAGAEALNMLRELLHEFDSPAICAGAVMGYDPDDSGLIALLQVFALPRESGWTGLSPHWPLLKDCHINMYESHDRPGTPGAFVAFPEELHDPDRTTPLPEGEPSRIGLIATWHGAQSFTWIPAG